MTKGYITVYVDDFLLAAEEKVMHQTLEQMAKTWECSPPELDTESSWTRYCGYEIKARKGEDSSSSGRPGISRTSWIEGK